MKRFFKISLITSIASYLLISFIWWDLLWIDRLPSYDVHQRLMCLWLLGVKICIDSLINLTNFLTTSKDEVDK